MLRRRGGGNRLGLFLAHAQLDHQAAQKFSFQLGVCRAGLPDGLVLLGVGVHLDHAAVADEDVGAAVGVALQAGAELVAFASGVQRIEHLAQSSADDILRQLGTVFSPVGFQDAQVGLVLGEDETVLQPELAHGLPQLICGAVDHEPALVAIALNAHVTDGGGSGLAGGSGLRRLLACLQGGCRNGAARHGVARIFGELGQVGGHFQGRALGRAFVVDLVAFKGRAG